MSSHAHTKTPVGGSTRPENMHDLPPFCSKRNAPQPAPPATARAAKKGKRVNRRGPQHRFHTRAQALALAATRARRAANLSAPVVASGLPAGLWASQWATQSSSVAAVARAASLATLALLLAAASCTGVAVGPREEPNRRFAARPTGAGSVAASVQAAVLPLQSAGRPAVPCAWRAFAEQAAQLSHARRAVSPQARPAPERSEGSGWRRQSP